MWSYSSTLSLALALDEAGGQRHVPPDLPQEKTWYPLYRRLGGSQGRSGLVRKISTPMGFVPQTVQLSSYTDWAIPAQQVGSCILLKVFPIINHLKTKRRLLYLKTQFVPRCKHFSSRL